MTGGLPGATDPEPAGQPSLDGEASLEGSTPGVSVPPPAAEDAVALTAAPAQPSGGPPGSRVFSIEGRQVPGLYVAAWFMGLLGGLLVILALFGASAGPAVLFLFLGLVALVLAFSAGAGYQLVVRARRPPEAYRGPAPLLVLGFVVALGTLVELLIGVTGVLDGRPTPTFVLAVLIPFGTYLLAIYTFVLRGGALAWPTILRLRPGPSVRRIGDWLVGAAAGIALVLPVLVFGAILTQVVGSTPDSALPVLTSDVNGLAIALGAAFVAPLGEELFFRGFAYTAWRTDLGVGAAIRRSAILFAAVHILNVQVDTSETLATVGGQLLVQFLVILPAALLLAFMYERRGLAASLGTHMAYNGGLLILATAATRYVQGG